MPKKVKSKLKPCPFCGSRATFSSPMSTIPGYQLGCGDREGCDVAPYSRIFSTRSKAIIAWNRRARRSKP